MSMIYMSIATMPSTDVGVYVKSHRNVIPELTESTVEVAGRHGFYDYGNNYYTKRYEEVDFFFRDADFIGLREHARRVADWLSFKGEIRFSDEPDKYYIGRTYTAPTLEQISSPSGRFTATFLVEPFAYGAHQSHIAEGDIPVRVPIEYPGTAPRCCQIIIRNSGDEPISNIQFIHNFLRRSYGGK